MNDERKPHEKKLTATVNQIDRFKELARELGCDEDEAAFEVALRKVAEAPPLPKHETKRN